MIDNNLLKMDIFYKEFNFENIVETPGYSVSSLFCPCMFSYTVNSSYLVEVSFIVFMSLVYRTANLSLNTK